MTNYERIKKYTIEEMAEFLCFTSLSMLSKDIAEILWKNRVKMLVDMLRQEDDKK